MEDHLLAHALEVAKQAAQEAGKKLFPHFGNVEAKSKGLDGLSDAFTDLDDQIESFLHDRLTVFTKDTGVQVGFRGEEQGTQSEAEITWLVDPIDGTAHFIRGLPFCTILISLIVREEVLLAVIHDIANQSTYWAIRGQGAFQDGNKISVSQHGLRQGLLAFETRLEDPACYEKYLRVRKQAIMADTFASGYTFALVASGKLDGKIALNPYGQDWDFAPGSLLVQEAGGVVRNIEGRGYTYRNHDFIMANEQVYQDLTKGPEAIFPID